MASRNVADLTPEVQEKVKRIVEVCNEINIDMLVYSTLRTLEEQAILYRQSRSWDAIKTKILKLNKRGFGFIGDILDGVGPCSGRHATNAGPGESWHNYAEAFDAVPLINGKAMWNYMKARSEWDAYGECIRQVGMVWGGDWINFRDYPHAQNRAGSNPLKIMNPDEVKEILISNKLL